MVVEGTDAWKPQREFTVDFGSGLASAHIRKDNKDVSEKIDIEPGGRLPDSGSVSH
jgi:hypothetical protein